MEVGDLVWVRYAVFHPDGRGDFGDKWQQRQLERQEKAKLKAEEKAAKAAEEEAKVAESDEDSEEVLTEE